MVHALYIDELGQHLLCDAESVGIVGEELVKRGEAEELPEHSERCPDCLRIIEERY